MQNLNLEIPIPAKTIDAGRLIKQNYGSYKNQKLTINKNFIASMANLLAQAIDLTINIPISYMPQGDKDITLSKSKNILINKNTESTYEIETQTSKIKSALP